MVPYLLNVCYLFLLVAVSPWLLWRTARHGKYRDGLGQKLWGSAPRRQGDRPCVWLHAVSVGEVNLLGTLLAEIGRRRPRWQCVVSTTTRTGYELARRKYGDLAVFYCPLDFTWSTRRAMRRIRPRLLVLAELELWPNLIQAARGEGAQVAIINGRLSDRSFRGYRRLRAWTGRWLERVGLIAVQNDEYRRRFVELGAPAGIVHVSGSIKFDGAETDRHNPASVRLRRLAGFDESDFVFLAGSTQHPEEMLAAEAFRELSLGYPSLRLVLVPRHRERFDAVAEWLDRSGLPWQRRSRLEVEGPAANARILLVDTIGELGAWWGTAQLAFVGGSLGSRGGQNMIEPAAYGAAVSFGPNTHNFRDIVADLLAHEAAVVVHDGSELVAFLRRSLADPAYAAALGARARALVQQQLGATARTFELLAGLVEREPSEAARAA